jgi:hypothetical protein
MNFQLSAETFVPEKRWRRRLRGFGFTRRGLRKPLMIGVPLNPGDLVERGRKRTLHVGKRHIGATPRSSEAAAGAGSIWARLRTRLFLRETPAPRFPHRSPARRAVGQLARTGAPAAASATPSAFD